VKHNWFQLDWIKDSFSEKDVYKCTKCLKEHTVGHNAKPPDTDDCKGTPDAQGTT
jgi:hypothetical protein